MSSHLYYTVIDEPNENCAKLVDFKYFVREEIEPDISIAEQFPISSFGSPSDILRIKGTETLISAFKSIYAKKLDVLEKLENLDYLGVTDKNEIILYFKNDDLTASGVYNFTYQFFEELFDMGKFSAFCIRNDYNDLLKDNLTRLFDERKTIEKQFRLIQKNNEFYLRGLTSPRYQNYDNNIALYLSLLHLHKFSLENNVMYKVTRAQLSDSEIRVFIEQEQPVDISGVGKMYFGIVLSNSEVRESALSIEMRYRLVGENDYTFAGTPELKDSLLTINHITGIDKIDRKFNSIRKLNDFQKSMITLISELKKIKTLSKDAIYKLYKKIIMSKNFKPETKKNFKDLYNKHDIENTKSLIEAFNKVNTITTDIDERTFLERIYHDLIIDLTSK